MSGASQRAHRMTSGPADPQLRCHPSSPRSPSWTVRSPSNRGQGSRLTDQRLLGNQSIRLGPTLASCLAGWLAPHPPRSPPFPCYGQMKTMQFSLLHTSLYVDILLQDKRCLCLPGARDSPGLMYLPCQPASISTNVWIERRGDGN